MRKASLSLLHRLILPRASNTLMPYVAIDPRCVEPKLDLDDGTAIGEVPAIWRYLEEV